MADQLLSQEQERNALTQPEVMSAVLAEYTAMRTELLKHIEIRYQVINYSLVIAGVLFGIGFNTRQPATFLAYPVLAMLLCWMWVDNGNTIMMIGSYIRDEIEMRYFQGRAICWELHIGDPKNYRNESRNGNNKDVVWSGSTFLITQVISITLAVILKPEWNTFFKSGLVFNVLVIVATVWLLRQHRKKLEAHLQGARTAWKIAARSAHE
jgi:hypothetical protein